MKVKKYNSFEEVDKDLKILQLKKDIAVWGLKNDCQKVQNYFTLQNILNNALTSFANKKTASILLKVAGSVLLGYFSNRFLKRKKKL